MRNVTLKEVLEYGNSTHPRCGFLLCSCLRTCPCACSHKRTTRVHGELEFRGTSMLATGRDLLMGRVQALACD